MRNDSGRRCSRRAAEILVVALTALAILVGCRDDGGTDGPTDAQADGVVGADTVGGEDAATPADTVASDTAADVVAPDAGPDAAADALVDAAPDATADDVAPDALADALVDATPDVTDDALVDVTPDAAPDAAADALVDATPDTLTDTAADVAADVAPDTGADGGGPVEPGVVDCERTLPAPATGTCAVTDGDDALLLQGIVLAPDAVYLGGEVLVAADGRIACVGCDCSGAAAAGGATVVTCPDGVISPGLINAHDHLTFTQNDPADWGDERYDHRHDWRKGLHGHTKISASGGASWREIAWGELRQVLSGATSIAGSGDADGFLRNVDRSFDTREGISADVDYETFPLGDSGGEQLASGCGYDDLPSTSVLSNECYLPHVAEGIDDYARNEFLCLSDDGYGVDITEPNAAFIHGVGLLAMDGSELAVNGTAIIWSPRSNVSLYGNTAPVTMYHNQGVLVGIGTDWTPSGSMNMQREIACATYLNDVHYGGFFSDRELWEMATINNAAALAIDDHVGALAAGLEADIAIFRATAATGGADTPFRAVLEGGVEDTVLVLRGGEPLYGDTAVMGAIPGAETGCEPIPGGVCGEAKTVCVQREIGESFASLSQANSGAYDLFFCGVPAGEPTCVPSRPGEYDGPTDADVDGDGVANGADNCPFIFNPVRPLDGFPGGAQGDHDQDGVGDVCDPCPLDPDTDQCTPPDPDDQDADGFANLEDNCPRDYNPEQADGDEDGIGDVCDLCPESPNPGGTACPATIYDVKLGAYPEGTEVSVTGVVTAVAAPRFFFQVPTAEQDADLGAAYSGVYVYVPTGNPLALTVPARGDRIRMTAEISNFFGQIQLFNPPAIEIVESGVALPAPVATTPEAVGTGGVDAEAYEAVLVTVEGEVTELNPPAGPGDGDPTNAYVLDGALRVNDFVWATDPFPQLGDVMAVTGVLRWANDDSKVEPRGPEDVEWLVAAPPRLVDFGPSPVYIDEGATAAESLPPLRVLLDRPAPDGGTSVDLTSLDAAVGVPRGVTVPAGEREAVVLLDGIAATDEAVTVQATLEGRTLEAGVVVLAAGRVPAPVAIEPAAPTVLVGTESTLTVTLDIPAEAGGTTVTLSSDAEGVATVPESVVVEAGAFTASFAVSGLAVGEATVSAVTAGGRADVLVTVSDVPPVGLVLSEVLYDVSGEDTGFEWVEIFNGTGVAIDLSGYSLGGGGTSYTYTTLQLSGTLPAGGCFVVGGPQSSADNGAPVFDLALDFDPDLQNSGSTADGVALFDVVASQIGEATVPIDAVVYGSWNDSGLIGPSGAAGDPDVGDADRGRSIERTADGWRVQQAPTPNDCSAVFQTAAE